LYDDVDDDGVDWKIVEMLKFKIFMYVGDDCKLVMINTYW